MTRRTTNAPSPPKRHRPSYEERKHLDHLLDEALEETFPASDPPAMLEPEPDAHVHSGPMRTSRSAKSGGDAPVPGMGKEGVQDTRKRKK